MRMMVEGGHDMGIWMQVPVDKVHGESVMGSCRIFKNLTFLTAVSDPNSTLSAMNQLDCN